ncbi:polyprenyl diphosphate synthase [Enterobacteriaceae endosymbiont of Neohaemonia nigricornis]|uniref:polyprenyl diphosphate synthase n=1 Tax=Enterobacteriaceae endosymbiont of Neohaemonia nigricornis TaxID=2675792 RepID=UPI0014497CC3|nr:polyprenyl diphosphate synthase [Enterobacteriaceae endosymbiont of Neohaemonia nigricornis]QJC30421.1 di-trans,poly-cis-decaprenylcistransferase [Enterobacteriaceae endosymbiont of Neohaemonia nigricornis]
MKNIINLLYNKPSLQHIAIIMDGNRRWAKKQGKNSLYGHKAGVYTVKKIIDLSLQFKLKVLTLYAFSSENWKRTKEEIDFLMNLFQNILINEIKNFKKHNININFIGNKNKLNINLQKLIMQIEYLTKKNTALQLNIAINYGGRQDIICGIKNIIKKINKQQISLKDINEKTFTKYLELHNSIPIDLVIRTGGEMRISNFLLWQIAYAELYFTNILWPDFNEQHFLYAIQNFFKRQRRFGK